MLHNHGSNGHRQWARPSLRVFILKELNAAECEGLACETTFSHAKDKAIDASNYYEFEF